MPAGSQPPPHQLACLCHLIAQRKHYIAAVARNDAAGLRKHAIKLRLAGMSVKLKPSSARLVAKAGKRTNRSISTRAPALGLSRGETTPGKAIAKTASSATRKKLFRQTRFTRVSWSYRFSCKLSPMLEVQTGFKCLVCLQAHQCCASLLQHVL